MKQHEGPRRQSKGATWLWEQRKENTSASALAFRRQMCLVVDRKEVVALWSREYRVKAARALRRPGVMLSNRPWTPGE